MSNLIERDDRLLVWVRGHPVTSTYYPDGGFIPKQIDVQTDPGKHLGTAWNLRYLAQKDVSEESWQRASKAVGSVFSSK